MCTSSIIKETVGFYSVHWSTFIKCPLDCMRLDCTVDRIHPCLTSAFIAKGSVSHSAFEVLIERLDEVNKFLWNATRLLKGLLKVHKYSIE